MGRVGPKRLPVKQPHTLPPCECNACPTAIEVSPYSLLFPFPSLPSLLCAILESCDSTASEREQM